jgi:hypothetical protein
VWYQDQAVFEFTKNILTSIIIIKEAKFKNSSSRKHGQLKAGKIGLL